MTIDFYQFLSTGNFGSIRLGDTKSWIFKNLPLANKNRSVLESESIWCYGSLEFQFTDNLLTAICCDNFPEIDFGNEIKSNLWLFGLPNPLNLADILIIFNTIRFNYFIKHNLQDSEMPIQLYLPASNILLFFDYSSEVNREPNNYKLVSFSHEIIDPSFLPHFIYD